MIWYRIKLWLLAFFIEPERNALPIAFSKSVTIHNKCGNHDCENRSDPRCVANSCTHHCKYDCGHLACLDIWRKQELAALKIAEERQAKKIFNDDDDAEEYLQ